MNRMTLAICGESQNGGYRIHRYAFLDGGAGRERPADSMYAMKLVKRLTDGPDDTSWVCGIPPKEHVRLFDVLLDVENHGKPDAKYKVEYRKYDGCPLQAIKDGMEIYSAIRKFGVRPAMQQVKRKRIKAEAEREEKRAEAARRVEEEERKPRFAVGGVYRYCHQDRFGHKTYNMVSVECFFNGREMARVRFPEYEKNVLIRDYGNADGEYFTYGSIVVRAADAVRMQGIDIGVEGETVEVIYDPRKGEVVDEKIERHK